MRSRFLTLAFAALLCVGGSASAQINDASIKTDQSNIEMLEMRRPLKEYGLVGLFLFAALAIGFMPSKRVKDA